MSVEQLPTETESRRESLMAFLFRDLQTTRMNEIYYEKRSSTMKRWSTGAKLLAAISSSAALVALLSNSDGGKWLLQTLTGLAAFAASIEFVLQWESEAARFAKASLGYGIVRERLKALIRDIVMDDLNDSHLARQLEINAIDAALTALNEPLVASVREAAWKQACEEFPSDQAWSLV